MMSERSIAARAASLPRRAGAMLYDTILLIALLMLATIPFVALRGGEMVEPSHNKVYQLVLAAVIFTYFVAYWSWKGRTLGMQSWGLQLQTRDGRVPGVAAASLRFFAALLSLAVLGLGFFWQLWGREHLTWHDRWSNTRLMHYPRAGKS
jgi:uncharacterized RDD family membrane protein YckC